MIDFVRSMDPVIDGQRCVASFCNDDANHPNCTMKRVFVDKEVHLALFVLGQDVQEGAELVYNYGDSILILCIGERYAFKKKSLYLFIFLSFYI